MHSVRMMEPIVAEEEPVPPADRPAIPVAIESPAAASVPEYHTNNVVSLY